MVPRAAEMQQRATQPRAATRKLPVILILAAQDQTKEVGHHVQEHHQRAMIQRAVSVVAAIAVAVIVAAVIIMPVKHAGIN